MELTALQKAMADYRSETPCPADFDSFWHARRRIAAEAQILSSESAGWENPAATFRVLRIDDGSERHLTAHLVQPHAAGPVPVILLFSDFDCAIRGWFHMLRFAALGFAVLSPVRTESWPDVAGDWRLAPAGLRLTEMYTDALRLTYAAAKLPGIDGSRLISWGEGLGGTLAIVTAALRPEVAKKCAALGPALADYPLLCQTGKDTGPLAGLRRHFRDEDPTHREEAAFFQALGYVDCIHFAARLQCPFLMGTGLMDDLSPAMAQAAVFNCASGEKMLLTYPKYAHERINDFENELVKFLRD